MNLQRRDEIRMMIARPAIGSAAEMMRDLHECKEALAETLAHIDALEQTAAERVIRDGSRGPTPDPTGEGSAWVPPKPVGTAALVKVHSWPKVIGPVGSMVWVDPQEVLRVAGIRVLEEEMVAVDREDLEILKRCFVILHRWGDYWLWANEANRQHWQNEKNEVLKMVYGRQIGSEALTHDAKHRNAIRASQGGVAT